MKCPWRGKSPKDHTSICASNFSQVILNLAVAVLQTIAAGGAVRVPPAKSADEELCRESGTIICMGSLLTLSGCRVETLVKYISKGTKYRPGGPGEARRVERAAAAAAAPIRARAPAAHAHPVLLRWWTPPTRTPAPAALPARFPTLSEAIGGLAARGVLGPRNIRCFISFSGALSRARRGAEADRGRDRPQRNRRPCLLQQNYLGSGA